MQFTLFIVLTVWLFQKGSPESKPLDSPGRESDERQRVGRHARAGSPAVAKQRGLMNWQSEFLAVGSMAIFAVYLRQRGSPESKPVGTPHDATGVEG